MQTIKIIKGYVNREIWFDLVEPGYVNIEIWFDLVEPDPQDWPPISTTLSQKDPGQILYYIYSVTGW